MNLKSNAAWSLSGSAVPLLAAVPAIPFLLRGFGTEGFGVLALIWALIGYFSLFDFGMGRALTVELGKRSRGTHVEQAAVLKAGLQLVLLAGVVGAALVYVAAAPLAARWLNISASWEADARAAFHATAFGVLATTLASGLRGAMEGLNRFAASNLNRMAAGLLQFSMPCVALEVHGPSLFYACVYLVVARCALALVAAYQLRAHWTDHASAGREDYRSILHFGLWATVSGLVSPLMVFGDRFLVGALLGTAMVSYYAIPQEGLQRLLILPTSLCSALLARLAGLDPIQALGEYKRNLRRVAVWHGSVCVCAAVLAFPAFSIWISPEFASAAIKPTLVLCLGIWLNGVALVPYTLLHAQANPRVTACFHLTELSLYVIAVWGLTVQFGILGAAWAWTLRAALDLGLLGFTAHRWGAARTGASRAKAQLDRSVPTGITGSAR